MSFLGEYVISYGEPESTPRMVFSSGKIIRQLGNKVELHRVEQMQRLLVLT
jgi:hypothetical protein